MTDEEVRERISKREAEEKVRRDAFWKLVDEHKESIQGFSKQGYEVEEARYYFDPEDKDRNFEIFDEYDYVAEQPRYATVRVGPEHVEAMRSGGPGYYWMHYELCDVVHVERDLDQRDNTPHDEYGNHYHWSVYKPDLKEEIPPEPAKRHPTWKRY